MQWYDENMKRGLTRVAAYDSAEQLLTPVEFFGVFNLPAVAYLGFLNNHSIHHRGELATYLRPMGSKVPSIYGGSYDEPFVAARSRRNRRIANCHPEPVPRSTCLRRVGLFLASMPENFGPCPVAHFGPLPRSSWGR